MDKCETCGGGSIDHCMVCGAPVCCPKCCVETTTELYEQMGKPIPELTKVLQAGYLEEARSL